MIFKNFLTINGLTETGAVVLHPPLKKGFLLANKSLVVELWNGFLLFTLLFSSGNEMLT